MRYKQHTARTSVKGTGLHYPDRAGMEENIDEFKYKLALASRILAMEELDEGGLNGHISLKLPNSNDQFLVNPFGFLFDEVTPDNLITVNKHGRVVEGRYPLNIAGFGVHSCIHEMYPGINCIVYTHSPWGSLFSAIGAGIEPIDQNCCVLSTRTIMAP
jgi:ribulose-5-phosphate 4-epimerase/fuculose-1-phosphate aldolase